MTLQFKIEEIKEIDFSSPPNPGFYNDGMHIHFVDPLKGCWNMGETETFLKCFSSEQKQEEQKNTISEDFALKMLAITNGQKLTNL